MFQQIVHEMDKITTETLKRIDPLYHQQSESSLQKCKRDIRYTIEFTLESIESKHVNILLHYYQWLYQTLSQYDVHLESIFSMFEALKITLKAYLSPQDYAFLDSIKVDELKVVAQNNQGMEKPLLPKAKIYLDYLLKKDRFGANQAIQQAIQQGTTLHSVYLDIIQPAMIEIGRLWQIREISVADEHMATVITQYVMTQLYPIIFATPKNGHRMVALALGSELHEIGIRMVADYFEYHGFETIYLGANVPVVKVIQTIQDEQVELVAISVTISTHLSNLKELIQAIRQADESKLIKIIIGGQAVMRIPNAVEYFQVDGFAFDAASAYELGVKLVE